MSINMWVGIFFGLYINALVKECVWSATYTKGCVAILSKRKRMMPTLWLRLLWEGVENEFCYFPRIEEGRLEIFETADLLLTVPFPRVVMLPIRTDE